MSSGEFIEICKEEVRKHNEQHMGKKRFCSFCCMAM